MIPAVSPLSPDPVAFIGDLIGRPYRAGAAGPDAFDCWNLFAHTRSVLFGRPTPFSSDLLDEGDGPLAVMHAIRTSDMHRFWRPVEVPRHGDLVLLARRQTPGHIGLWIDLGPGLCGIMHCFDGPGGAVAIDSIAQVRGTYPNVLFFRDISDTVEAIEEADQRFLQHVAEAPVAIRVKDILNPLEGAEVIELKVGDRAGAALEGCEDPDAHWLVLGDMPLLRQHPETGENEHDRLLVAGDIVWVLPPLPLGGDARGSQVLASVLAIVVSIAAPWAAGLVFAQGTLAHSVLAAGLSIGFNALIQAVVPRPPEPAELSDPEPTYSFSGIGNRRRPGATIPDQFGTMHFQPDLVAPLWAEFIDNEQIVHILFSLGEGAHRLNEFGSDDTPVWTSEQGYTGAIQSVEHEVVLPGEEITLFPGAIEVSTEVDGLELPEPETSDGTSQQQIIGPFAAVASGRTAIEIIVDFVFPVGLFEFDNGEKNASVTWQVAAQLIDDRGQPIGFAQVLETITFTAATTTPQRMTKRYPVTPGRYAVWAVRTSESEVDGTGAQDRIVWAGLRAKLRSEVTTYPDVTLLAVKLRAGTSSQAGLTNWYAKTTAVLPHIDIASGKIVTGPTEQIDAAILKIAQSPVGLGIGLDDIDMPTLTTLARTWAARGDVCCTRIERGMTAWDALKLVLTAGRTRPSFLGTTLTFARDERRVAPSRLITQGDIVRGSFSVDRVHFRRDTPKAVNVVYRDRQGRMRSMMIPPEADQAMAATYRSQVHVDPEQVWRDGSFMEAENRLRRRSVSFILLENGRALVPGQLVRVAHPRADYGHPGRAVRLDGLLIEMSGETGLQTGEYGFLHLARPDGSLWGPVACIGVSRTSVQIDRDDLDDHIQNSLPHPRYSSDFRDWLVTELAPESGSGQTELTGNPKNQSKATACAVGKDIAKPIDCIISEVLPDRTGRVEVLAAVENNAVHEADSAALPQQSDIDEPLSNDAAPKWEDVIVRGLIVPSSSPPTAEYKVSGPEVPGAVQYLVEVSINSSPPQFERVATSPTPDIAGPFTLTDDALIRVAAAGPLYAGPWTVYRTNFGNAVTVQIATALRQSTLAELNE